MPQLKVLFWNIQNFGNTTGYRARDARISYIVNVVAATQPDVLCIQEVKQNAVDDLHLTALHQALNSLPEPFNNWYYDVIKGALSTAGDPPDNYPFSDSADLMWDAAHYEGYALYWNQNIAKFVMQAAPPIQPPGGDAVANTQSQQCRMQGRVNVGNQQFQPFPGAAVPDNGLQVPANAAGSYVIPAGTDVPHQGILQQDAVVAAGEVVPAGTVVGPGGITLNAQTYDVNPVVVPGGFTLTEPLTLPAADTVVVPAHALGLVMFGRDSSDPEDLTRRPSTANADISADTANFAPNGDNFWNWIEFTRSAGYPAVRTGSRRPAYVTLRVNRPNSPGAADQLLPLIVYHAPSASPASSAGMQRAAYSQPMYQAYDWGAGDGGAWIDCGNALLGGDFNVIMGAVQYAYDAFLDAWGNADGRGGGAGATMAIANPAPVNGTMADNPLNKSIVSLTYGVGGDWVFSDDTNDYRVMAIDNIFYRGLGGNVLAQLLDLMVESSGQGALTGVAVQNCEFTPSMQQAVQAAQNQQNIQLPNMNAPLTTLFDILAGSFGAAGTFGNQDTPARRVAEFVNLFASDHLPAGIQFDM